MTEQPIKKPTAKMRHCWYCGEAMGVIESKYYESTDTCGKSECEREARAEARAKHEEAHAQLDRDMGL